MSISLYVRPNDIERITMFKSKLNVRQIQPATVLAVETRAIYDMQMDRLQHYVM